MNRAILSRGTPILRLRRNVNYRQDMPPPGGYGYQPWRRNIPTRGFGFIGMLVFGCAYILLDRTTKTKKTQLYKEWMVSAHCLYYKGHVKWFSI